MIKEVLFEKEVITVIKFKDLSTNFMKYKSYKFGRQLANMDIQTHCFCCGTEFIDEEELGLLFNGNQLNQLCCEKCAIEFVNS